jgi:hypothetical protein
MTIEQIGRILSTRRFSDLLGHPEDATLEVKEAPYDLSTAAGRYELAKDVSGLANVGGGYLLIGIATRREAERQRDLLDRLTLIPAARFNDAQYRGIITDYIHPEIQNLAVSWSHGEGVGDGLGIIFVPPQPDERKPFITAKVVEDGDHLKHIVVGFVERVAAGNEPLSPKRIQELLRKGRDGTSQRLTRIEERLDQLTRTQLIPAVPAVNQVEQPTVVSPFDAELLDARIHSMLENFELPVYVIAAIVPRGNRIREFNSTRPNAPRDLLRDAGELRDAGFDLGIGAAAEPGPDGSLQAVQGERKCLRLFRDGTLIFRALADDSFLGWARNAAAFQASPRLNPVPVAEVHASFASFYAEMLARVDPGPCEVMFKLVLRNHVLENGRRLYLTEHQAGDIFEWIDRHTYPVEVEPPEATHVAPANQLQTDPLAVAYQLVERFASLFDLPSALIPFTVETGGVRRIDLGALTRR